MVELGITPNKPEGRRGRIHFKIYDMKIKNFTKTIEMQKVVLDFKDKMSSSQFNLIVSLRKKQIGKVTMNYEEMKRYLTKKDAMKLIELMLQEYWDINVVLLGKTPVKKRDYIPINDGRFDNTQMTMTRLDMLENAVNKLYP